MWITVEQTVLEGGHVFQHRVLYEGKEFYGIENLTQPFNRQALPIFLNALITRKEGSMIATNGDGLSWRHD